MRDVRLSVVVPPAVEPLTLAEVWTDLRLDPSGSPPTTYFDTELNSFIASAREHVEKATRRSLVTQTCGLTLTEFPGGIRWNGRLYGYGGSGRDYDSGVGVSRCSGIELPRPPVQSVTSVIYYDINNASQTLDPASYRLVKQGDMPAILELVGDGDWPETAVRRDAVTITYIAGYAPAGSPPDYRVNVPAALKSAMKLHVRKMFNPLPPQEMDRLDTAIENLVGGFRVERF